MPSPRSRARRRASGPRTPSPSGPKSSGSFSTAAAPMIGVARRNANRAASWFESPDEQTAAHRRSRAREAGDQRQSLRGPHADGLLPADLVAILASAASDAPSSTVGACRRRSSAP